MKRSAVLVVWLLSAGVCWCSPAGGAEAKNIYHWPWLKLTAYMSARNIYYPNGDIDARRAFYWGRVLGSDGLGFTIRGLLPHIVEGNWQEPVYTSPVEKTYIFELVADFQRTYAAQGCGDNFMQFHTHAPLYGESIEQWRSAVIASMTQKAELASYAGVPRILLDNEFTNWAILPTDPDFWYELGRDVITAVRGVDPDLRLGFYPGLLGYWQTLSAQERSNPKAIGSYPEETSIPESRRNMRHALYQGIHDHLGGSVQWEFGAFYGPVHMCYGTPEKTYLWNLQEHFDQWLMGNEAMLGPGIEWMIVKGDLGSRQPEPVSLHWKQPNLHLGGQQRNYELIYQYTDLAGNWDYTGGWDEDGPFYLSYSNMNDFITALSGIGFASAYQYDSVTGEEHQIVVPPEASLSQKLSWFNIYAGTGGYHIQGKLAENFSDYVNTMIVAAGKDQLLIPLHNAAEYQWAVEYQAAGFFQNHEVVQTSDYPGLYGYLKPLTWPGPCPELPPGDLNQDCRVDMTDLALFGLEGNFAELVEMAANWLACADLLSDNCHP